MHTYDNRYYMLQYQYSQHNRILYADFYLSMF